jgi:hypothetical protein
MMRPFDITLSKALIGTQPDVKFWLDGQEL